MSVEVTEASDSEARDRRIGRIVSDLYDRRARGEPAAEEQILAENPELADDLRRYLAVIGELTPGEHDIDGLVSRGVLTESQDPAYRASLGAYKTIEFLGRGAMGIVLKAYEEDLDRTVALKIIRPDLAGDSMALARFKREARAAAALQHPNIVTVYAVGEEQGVHYLVMEYVEGPTLAELIDQQGPLPAETIRRLIGQLLCGLEAAHQAGLIHRDIKPSNLLLDRGLRIADRGLTGDRPDVGESGASPAGSSPPAESSIVNPQSLILKLADFGLARMATARTRITLTKHAPGTPEYMSPEQARGDPELDQRTDLYSAGVVLYEMLTGDTPFSAPTEAAVLRRILDEDPADPRTINEAADPHLASLALRLLAKLPEDRFASAAEAIKALDASKRVQSLAARRIRRRWMIASLIFLGLALGAGALGKSYATRGNRVSKVRIDPDTPLALQVRRGNKTEWEPFYEFPPEARRVTAIGSVDLHGKGRSVVVAGIQGPIDGHSLFVFEALGGEPSWSLDLSSTTPWPDCARPPEWYCEGLATANVDGEPGDEIIAVGTDWFEYPTRISVVDPRTRSIRSTFWHMGNISRVRVAEDFFGPGLPAIVATGRNNKLDGFDEPSPGDEARRTRWNIVVVAMILDPRNMEGLGPPLAQRPELRDSPPAYLHAYAFLDLPASPDARYGADGKPITPIPEPSDVTTIGSFEDSRYSDDPEIADGFTLGLTRPLVGGGATLTLDRNLDVRVLGPASGARPSRTLEFWKEHWHVIIQDGEYVE